MHENPQKDFESLYQLSNQCQQISTSWTCVKEFKIDPLFQQTKQSFIKDSSPETEPFELGDLTGNRTPISY